MPERRKSIILDNFYNDKSLFRFSIIAPIINNTHGFASINEYISFAANKTYTFDNKDYRFSKSCIKNWYLSFISFFDFSSCFIFFLFIFNLLPGTIILFSFDSNNIILLLLIGALSFFSLFSFFSETVV